MDTSRIDKQRTELFHFVLWLLLVLLGAMSYFSFKHFQGSVLPWLTIVALLACLYAVGRERQLTKQRQQLRHDLIEEQDKSASLEGRLMELSGLYRAISAVNAGTSPEATFDTVLRSALGLVEGNRGSLMLLNEDEDYLVIAAAEGLSEDVVAETRQHVGEGVAGWVAENREPLLLVGSALEDERFESTRAPEVPLTCSISVPLTLRDSLLGVLNIGIVSDEPREGFGDYHLRMATIFAQHASVAIENARLRLMHNVIVTVES